MNNYHSGSLRHPIAITLRAQNIHLMKKFYTEGMGLKILKEEPEKITLTVDGDREILTLITNPDIVPKPRGRAGLYHFAILLPSRRDLGSFIRHILDYGANHIGGSNHGVSEAFYMEDPEGNGIEVYSDIPDTNWEYESDKPVMYTKPLDYKGILREAEGSLWKGMPATTVLGHIHLHVGDLDSALRFYKVLGFQLVHSMAASACFVSTGGYHHHIGFNVWNGRGAQPAPENASGLDSFLLTAAGEDLGELEKKLNEAGYFGTIEDGELLTRDPSGNRIIIK